MASDSQLSQGAYFGIAGLGALSGMFEALGANRLLRANFRIKKIEGEINDILAESAFKDEMSQLFKAQGDRRAAATQEVTAAFQEWRSRLAASQVARAERGQEGLSVDAEIGNLARSFHAYKQLALMNLQTDERAMLYQRMAINNKRFATKYANLIQGVPPLGGLGVGIGAAAKGFMNTAMMTYGMVDWS